MGHSKPKYPIGLKAIVHVAVREGIRWGGVVLVGTPKYPSMPDR